MSVESLIALALAIAIFAASPGPAVFAIVTRTLASGFWPGALFLVGCVTGDVIYLLLAVYGLSFVANSLSELFIFIKLAGAGYLIWLGIKLWRSAAVAPGSETSPQVSKFRGFGEGLLVTLGSPKAIFFFGALLPTFLDIRSLSGTDIAIVAAIVAIGIVSVNAVYVVAAARARSLLQSRQTARWFNRATGSVMIGSGVALASR
ncbi:MAG: LysE family translocator [Gammaproteobacteria bacterium]|nr:LysE family translocator [Gammaproteobacteria bacterium]